MIRTMAAAAVLSLLGLAAIAEAPEGTPVPPAAPEDLRADVQEGAGPAADDAAETTSNEAPEDASVPPEEAPVPPPAPEAGRETAADENDGDDAGPSPGPARAAGEIVDNERDEPGEPVVVAPPDAGPSFDPERAKACEAELAGLGVTFERADALEDKDPCGTPRPLRVTAIGGVELRPEVTLRCDAARALALWIDRVAAPLASLYLDEELSAVLAATGYQCRRRRGDGTAKWSEHAFANAVDVWGIAFENGDTMSIRPREDSEEPERSYQAGIRGGACAFFTTVLGPTTNGAHADHLHLDMAERHGGYRLCE